MRKHWKALGRLCRENADVWLGLFAVFCLFEAVDLGWHAHQAFQQHLKPTDIIAWTSRPHGGYSVTEYTLSELNRSAWGYLAGGVTALLVLARRHGVHLRRGSAFSVKPRSKRRRYN